MNLADHDEPSHLFIQVEIGLLEHPPARAAHHVEVDRVPRFDEPLGEVGLVDLTWLKKDYASLTLQCAFNCLSLSALNRISHLCQETEGLQGWSGRYSRRFGSAPQGWRSIRPKHRQTPVAVRGRVAARVLCAYGVQ